MLTKYTELWLKTIGADTEIADNLMGRGSENRALLRAIYQRLNEVIGEEE